MITIDRPTPMNHSSLDVNLIFPLTGLDSNPPLLDEILAEALHVVRSNLKMEVAFISTFQNGLRVFRHTDAHPYPTLVCAGNADPLEDSYCQRIVDGRFPELIQDTAQVPEAMALPVTQALGIGAYMGVPIHFSDGSLYGTFCCFSSQPNYTLNDSDLCTLRLFADFSGRLIEKQVLSTKRHDEMRAQITSVLNNRLINIVYQPIINVAQDKVVGYEALARFPSEPQRPPDLWFGEAAEVGLEVQLEIMAIEEALKGLKHFPEESYISLNASPSTILCGALAHALVEQPLTRLMLEVTEHISVEDYGSIAMALEPLRRKGMLLAVDDAGAGYASFRHILMLKPDVIKLDRSLIQSITSNTDYRALAGALIRFAEETGSKVVAEGVETDEELALLRSLRVNNVQGFLLGRPMPMSHYVF